MLSSRAVYGNKQGMPRINRLAEDTITNLVAAIDYNNRVNP